MQHVIEEDSTQEDGQKVPSHGWPTWNTGNEAKIMTQMIYTMTYLQALVNKETYRGKNRRNWCQPVILETPTKYAEREYFFLSLIFFKQHNTIHV